MCITERYPVVYEIVGGICRIGKAVLCTCFHNILAEFHSGNHACEQSDTAFYCVDRVKGQFLVFLHVFVVGERNAFHGCKDGSQCTIDTACFSSYKLCDIRILLLRHDAASCAVGIVDLNETVLVGVPEDDLLAETAQMHHDSGDSRKKLDHVIPVRYGIHAVSCRLIKAKQLCGIESVQRVGGSCKCACTERTGVHTLADVCHTASVSAEHLEICTYMVCQGNRLCFLKMCESRHVSVHIVFHNGLKCFQKFLEFCVDLFDLVADIKFHVKGNLVVTASSCVKLLARISDTVDQICLYKAVDVFIFGCDLQLAGFYVCKDAIQSFKNLVSLFFCQDSLFCKHSDMCFASADVLFIKFLVK